MLKMLRSMDPKKSANGVPPVFWKECAEVIAPSIDKLFKFIAKKAKFVSRWKHSRVSAPAAQTRVSKGGENLQTAQCA